MQVTTCEKIQTRIAVRVEGPAACLDGHVGLAAQGDAEVGGDGGVAGAEHQLRPVVVGGRLAVGEEGEEAFGRA